MIERIFENNPDAYYVDVDTLKVCYNELPFNPTKFKLYDTGRVFCLPDVEYVDSEDLPLLHYVDRNMVEHIVTDIGCMFYNASSLKRFNGTGWNTSTVTNASYMFQNCTDLEQVEMDFHSITDANELFANCTKLVNVSPINMARPETAYRMFYRCHSLKQLDTSQLNMNFITDCVEMFYDCRSLEQLDTSNWTMNCLKHGKHMFALCNSLKQLDTSRWSMNNLLNANSMFFECNSLEALDASNWGMSSVLTTSRMFWGCNSLESLDVSKWDVHSIVNMEHMFYCCYKLNTSLNSWNVNTEAIKDGMIDYSQIPKPGWL